jgi:signal transduction histidine kinase
VLMRHGAQLEIDSTPGQGSTFTAKFPMRSAIVAAPQVETSG